VSRTHSPSSNPARFGGPSYCLSCGEDWPCHGHYLEEADARRAQQVTDGIANALTNMTVRALRAEARLERIEAAAREALDAGYTQDLWDERFRAALDALRAALEEKA
jgi:hypothetical protein